jgi:hypothetical protein
MDFATILDYGYKQQKKNVEGTKTLGMKEVVSKGVKKALATK